MHVAGSKFTVAGLAALNGQPLVLTIYEAVNPDLSVGDEERGAGQE